MSYLCCRSKDFQIGLLSGKSNSRKSSSCLDLEFLVWVNKFVKKSTEWGNTLTRVNKKGEGIILPLRKNAKQPKKSELQQEGHAAASSRGRRRRISM